MVVHICNPSTWETEQDSELRPIWATQQDSIPLSPKKKQNKKKKNQQNPTKQNLNIQTIQMKLLKL
jgi:hypothetical protein